MHSRTVHSNKLAFSIVQFIKVRNATVREITGPLARSLVRFSKQLRLWNQRRKQRRDLYRLSDSMLKDIGISRLDAVQEATKPFWQP